MTSAASTVPETQSTNNECIMLTVLGEVGDEEYENTPMLIEDRDDYYTYLCVIKIVTVYSAIKALDAVGVTNFINYDIPQTSEEKTAIFKTNKGSEEDDEVNTCYFRNVPNEIILQAIKIKFGVDRSELLAHDSELATRCPHDLKLDIVIINDIIYNLGLGITITPEVCSEINRLGSLILNRLLGKNKVVSVEVLQESIKEHMEGSPMLGSLLRAGDISQAKQEDQYTYAIPDSVIRNYLTDFWLPEAAVTMDVVKYLVAVLEWYLSVLIYEVIDIIDNDEMPVFNPNHNEIIANTPTVEMFSKAIDNDARNDMALKILSQHLVEKPLFSE